MGVQFNIKDEETIRLARELAAELGESVTAAIRVAVRDKIASLDTQRPKKPTLEEAKAFVKSLKGHWKPEYDGWELSTRHGELLYDEDGLPK